MGISHLNRLCCLFLEVLHETLFCNFLCCTAASGPYLVTNMKALMLHEHKIDHGKISYGGAAVHTVQTELDDQKLQSWYGFDLEHSFIYFLNFFISLKVL